MKYNKEYKRSSFEPSIHSNNATSGGSTHYSKELYKKKESRNKPYSVLQRVEPRNRKRVENSFRQRRCREATLACVEGDEEFCQEADDLGCWDDAFAVDDDSVTRADSNDVKPALRVVSNIVNCSSNPDHPSCGSRVVSNDVVERANHVAYLDAVAVHDEAARANSNDVKPALRAVGGGTGCPVCPECPDIPLDNTSEDDNWWTDYNQLMWFDDEHYNAWKKKLDSRDGIRGDLKDLPGPGRRTWDWNKVDSTVKNHPFYNGQYPDEDPRGGFGGSAWHGSMINILYHSKQAHQELTYEIVNGKLKSANKKKIRRQWLIKLMRFISKAFIDVIQLAASRLKSILNQLMIETNGQINQQDLKQPVFEFESIINNYIVVFVDNLTLLDYVWDTAQLGGTHDHDPDSYYTILNDEIGSWTSEILAEHRSQSASYRMENQGGGKFKLTRNDADEIEMDDYDTGDEEDPATTAVGSATGNLTTTQLALADVIRSVARNEGLTDIEYEVLAGRFPPLNRQLVELAELDPRPRAVTSTMMNEVSMIMRTELVHLRTEADMENAGSAYGPTQGDADLPTFPSKQNIDKFKRISKLLITAIIKDEPLPHEVIQMYNNSPQSLEEGLTFAKMLRNINQEIVEDFGPNAPQLDASTSPMSKYIAAAAMIANNPERDTHGVMQGIKMLMAYISLHMEGESDWIIETFGELLDSKYKDTKPIIFAAQFIKKLNNVIKQSEGVSNTNVADTVVAAGRAAERVTELETQLAGRRARVTELQTQLAARPTRSELVSLETELETARGNIQSLEEAMAMAEAQKAELAAAVVAQPGIDWKSIAETRGETVDLKMGQIEDLGEEIIALKAELEEEKAKTNVPANAEEIRQEEKEECKKEINIYEEKIIEEKDKVKEDWDKDIEKKDKMIKYGGIGAGVVIVLLILFLLMK